MLLEDGGDVGLAHVISEGAVAEDDSGFSGRFQILMPGYEGESQRFYVVLRNGLG